MYLDYVHTLVMLRHFASPLPRSPLLYNPTETATNTTRQSPITGWNIHMPPWHI